MMIVLNGAFSVYDTNMSARTLSDRSTEAACRLVR